MDYGTYLQSLYISFWSSAFEMKLNVAASEDVLLWPHYTIVFIHL